MSDTQKDIYAKVDGGKLIEFPVTVDTILGRGHSVFQYTPVVFNSKPPYDSDTSTTSQSIRIETGRVVVDYVVQQHSLSQLLTSFRKSPTTAKAVDEISLSAIHLAKSLISNYVETQISIMASYRGYSSLNNVLGRYSNSANPKYKAEALYIQKQLDDSWDKLEVFFQDIMEKKALVPTSLADIDAVVGKFSWDNYVEAE